MGIHASFTRTSRAAIEDQIERLIALLDIADGDIEEANGDELDYLAAEDDFGINQAWCITAIGCPISDPAEEDDQPWEAAQPERRAEHAQ